MPPASFTPRTSPVASAKSRTACSITSATGGVAAGLTLPVEVLMKSAPASSASTEARRTLSSVASSPVSRMTFRCAVPQAARVATISSKHLPVAPGEERAAVDHHVDLVRAGLDRVAHVGELGRERCAARRERRRDARDVHAASRAAPRPRPRRGRDRRTRRRPAGVGRVARIGPHRLRAQRAHLAGRVRALERGQVDHADRRCRAPRPCSSS